MSATPIVTPEQCAKAGASFLDEAVPDWYWRVNIKRLDMGEGLFDPQETDPDAGDYCGCVGSQIDATERAAIGYYDRFCDEYMSGESGWGVRAVALGFITPDDEPGFSFAALTKAWLVEIDKRRVAS